MGSRTETSPGLSPFYLNSNRLGALASTVIPAEAQISLNTNSIERVKAMQYAGSIAQMLIRSGKIANLAAAYEADPFAGQWLAFTSSTLMFKGARQAFDDEARGKPVRRATFNGKIVLGDEIVHLAGELFNQHFFSQSLISMLSRSRPVFVMGLFTLDDGKLELVPYIIGSLVDATSSILNWPLRSSIRLYPDSIDSFAKLVGTPPAEASEVAALQKIPESYVKKIIAEIIGETFVPVDWGGEASDLQTNQLVVDGKPISAAFLLKGPGLSGEMHPGNMGKRGDQMIRAFSEPVDLVVIQHCNKIANTVAKQAEAFALDPRNPKKFCIIDGNDTVRLLKAYGKL